ncbi:MAG: hypothetical protein ACLR17_02010 [Enterobacteriaceae bacterium]
MPELASLFIQPLLPVLAVEYDVPVSQVVSFSPQTALLAIGLLFTGTLSDHYSRKKLIIVSLLLGGLLTMLCPPVNHGRFWWPCMRLLAGAQRYRCARHISEVAPVVAGVITGYFVFGNSMGGCPGIVASQLIDHISIKPFLWFCDQPDFGGFAG